MSVTTSAPTLPDSDDIAADSFEPITCEDVIVGMAESEAWFNSAAPERRA